MDFSPKFPQPQHNSAQTPTLQVDFSWKKFQTLITEHDKPSDPIYIVDYRTVKSPHIIFKSATDKKTIGTGTLHPISINANYEIQGQKGTLKALKRFQTVYSYLSQAFSENDSPATMTWTCSCGFKTWDFICLDEQQMPVAKFSANVWAVNKVGNIEFLGSKNTSPAVRDEIVVTGLTLLYCLSLRSSSILSFFGAIFARPGPLDNVAAAESQHEIVAEHDKNVGSVPKHEVVGDKNQAVV